MAWLGKILEAIAEYRSLRKLHTGKYPAGEVQRLREGRMDDFAIARYYSKGWRIQRLANWLKGK